MRGMRVMAVALVLGLLASGALVLGAGDGRGASGVDLRKLPLGDGKTSTSGAQRGWLYQCRVQSGGGGASGESPWIDFDAGTYDLTAKPIVDGRVSWSDARVRV